MSKTCTKGIAFLWDESFLWGIMAMKALRAAGLPFDLVKSGDIRKGCLKNYGMLFVPGGWSSNKAASLKDKGIRQIHAFVNSGGAYVGFCGGAGLATQDGIGLLNINRKPTRERVPSFSGRISLSLISHPIFQGVTKTDFHAWWPPQFNINDSSIKILATYRSALFDAFSSDLNVADVMSTSGWQPLEDAYKINLDPVRLLGEPAVVEGKCGKGTVLLSLVHFDTPDDKNSLRVLKNLWKHLSGTSPVEKGRSMPLSMEQPLPEKAVQIADAADELIQLGVRNFLWFWRTPMLLQWRRGIRGLEFCTLHVMIEELAQLLKTVPASCRHPKHQRLLATIHRSFLPFARKAHELLILERHALQAAQMTYEQCSDPQVKQIRSELFAGSKSYGGAFKKILDDIDRLYYELITAELGLK